MSFLTRIKRCRQLHGFLYTVIVAQGTGMPISGVRVAPDGRGKVYLNFSFYLQKA